jgi:hypothetical protein
VEQFDETQQRREHRDDQEDGDDVHEAIMWRGPSGPHADLRPGSKDFVKDRRRRRAPA